MGHGLAQLKLGHGLAHMNLCDWLAHINLCDWLAHMNLCDGLAHMNLSDGLAHMNMCDGLAHLKSSDRLRWCEVLSFLAGGAVEIGGLGKCTVATSCGGASLTRQGREESPIVRVGAASESTLTT